MDLLSWIKAKKAQQTADNVQNQLNQAVAAGDQLSEVQQARVGKDGTVYTTLNDRLNGEKGQTETSLTNTNNRIDTIDAKLSGQEAQTTTLLHGLNVVTTDQATPTDIKMYGRTLVNLLGKDGNFEKQGNWDATMVIDTSSCKFDSASGKIDNSAGTAPKGSQNSQKIYLSGKRILIGFWAKSVSGTPTIEARLFGFDSSNTNTTTKLQSFTSSNLWKFYYFIVDLTANTETYWEPAMYVDTFGTANDVVNFDGLYVYEIPQSIYDKIDVDPAYTGDALADKFPYVDSVMHVMNPYVKNSGKNLISPVTSGKWTLDANAKVISDYELDVSSCTDYSGGSYAFKAVENSAYSFSVDVSGYVDNNNKPYYAIQALDKDGNIISTMCNVLAPANGKNTNTVTTPINTKTIKIVFLKLGTGTFTFTNPQLELGSTATPFEPQNESYLYVAQDADKNHISLASNNDGSVSDEVYQRDSQWYRLNRFKRDMVLDGSLAWVFADDYTGFKRTKITPFNGAISTSPYATKFDESIIASLDEIKDTALDGNRTTIDTTNDILYISIFDTDSGWGESYTPSAGEINAYFYGWKMNNGTFGTAYTGTTGDVKTWVPIGDTDNTRATTTLPTADAPTIAEGKIDHYKLTYQLAQATEETIEVEGSLDLIVGGNQIQVGEGVIVREKVTPVNYGSVYTYINDPTADGGSGSSLLNNKAKNIIQVYKNGDLDGHWWIEAVTNGNGVHAITEQSNFDPTAEYTVTYIALDTYKLSSAENDVEVDYNTNLKTVVDELVQRLDDDETDISVLKHQMIDVIARLQAGGL